MTAETRTLSVTMGDTEQLLTALKDALKWIAEECQPEAEFVGQGHNWNMNDEDRARAQEILTRSRSIIAKIEGAK